MAGPLQGVKVVELALWVAGPSAAATEFSTLMRTSSQAVIRLASKLSATASGSCSVGSAAGSPPQRHI